MINNHLIKTGPVFLDREKKPQKNMFQIINRVLLVSIIKNIQAPKLIENRISRLAGAELESKVFWRRSECFEDLLDWTMQHSLNRTYRTPGWSTVSNGPMATTTEGVAQVARQLDRMLCEFFTGFAPCPSTNSQGNWLEFADWIHPREREHFE